MRLGIRVKQISFVFGVLFLSTVLVGCMRILSMTGGSGDWTFQLPNDYQVSHVNNDHICISFGGGTHVIDRYIVRFSYNQRYVSAQQMPIDEHMTDTKEVKQILEESTSADYLYYLIDTQTDVVYGPFDVVAYDTKCKELNIDDLSEWIDTAAIAGDKTWEEYYSTGAALPQN